MPDDPRHPPTSPVRLSIEHERLAISAAPPCPFCGAPVSVSEGGRLEIVHDWSKHHAEQGARREEKRKRADSAQVYGRDP